MSNVNVPVNKRGHEATKGGRGEKSPGKQGKNGQVFLNFGAFGGQITYVLLYLTHCLLLFTYLLKLTYLTNYLTNFFEQLFIKTLTNFFVLTNVFVYNL